MIKAVLFDMDGVLVDSEDFICEAAVKMFAEMGTKVQPEDFIPFIGTGENRYIGGVAEKYGIKLEIDTAKERTYAIYCEIIKGRLKPLNGVFDFIERCRDKGLNLAVATSADQVKLDANLSEIGMGQGTFDVLVNGLQVEKKKPDPEIYQKAAGQLGVSPKDCLVVEDAVNGIEAGKNAGARCLGVLSSFSAEELTQADWTCKDLSEAPEECLSW